MNFFANLMLSILSCLFPTPIESQVSYDQVEHQELGPAIQFTLDGVAAKEIYQTLANDLLDDTYEGLIIKNGFNLVCIHDLTHQQYFCSQIIDRYGDAYTPSPLIPEFVNATEPLYELTLQGEVAKVIYLNLETPNQSKTEEEITKRGAGIQCTFTIQTTSYSCHQEIVASGITRPGGFDPIVRVGNASVVADEVEAFELSADLSQQLGLTL